MADNDLPARFEGTGDGHHSLEYLNATIDVSDVNEIKLSKDHDRIVVTEHD